MATATNVTKAGRYLLRDTHLNHGTAFTREERAALGLEGLLPPGVLSLEEQAQRAYEQYGEQPTDLAKNEFLAALHDRNEILYYKILEDHLTEMLPVVYDPVVAEAIERYSHEFQRPDGVYLSVDDIDGVETAFRNYGLGADDVDLLVATDAEEILGIGDWGSNGMDISIGKLAVYTAAAGIHPDRVIPVMIDVGTDRESLLNDPLYVGNRHSRVRGDRYDRLVAAYVDTASRLFPDALLHFEDFGPSNARRILTEYREKARIFNDDMQGTGAITLAAILAGMRVSGSRPSEQRVVIFGAGTAGVGIADQIRTVMVADGLSDDDATRHFWLVDKQGLLVDDMGDLRDFQQAYARPRSEVSTWGAGATIDLAEVVAKVHPTIIVGTSTVGGAFTEQIVREMAKHVERPMLFPLSNPTERIEAIPADVIKWTDGRGLVGTGTPWRPVSYKGVDYRIGQANNALIYPGIGLGTIVARASHVTDGMLLAASHAIAGLVDVSHLGAGLLPEVENLRAVSATVAVAVVRQAVEDGVAQGGLSDPVQAVQDAMWQAIYPEVK
ncbi:MAG TPA: NAD-dependent malic enzyme [Solirubrobacteraceae bacterium]|jgi:malate dehydrogenase (oxaloacetate-decarboxylating)|nr:NAD-dependent malic enzyme [Solirubrobacteraceae bacterium]